MSDLAIERLRGLAAVRRMVEAATREAVAECRAAGVDAWEVAGVLGVDRSTLYRRYPARLPARAGQGPTQEGEAHP
jgi:transcriptional regulator of acetoin/glycerol metabolism